MLRRLLVSAMLPQVMQVGSTVAVLMGAERMRPAAYAAQATALVTVGLALWESWRR